jgi:hypothetical protein
VRPPWYAEPSPVVVISLGLIFEKRDDASSPSGTFGSEAAVARTGATWCRDHREKDYPLQNNVSFLASHGANGAGFTAVFAPDHPP